MPVRAARASTATTATTATTAITVYSGIGSSTRKEAADRLVREQRAQRDHEEEDDLLQRDGEREAPSGHVLGRERPVTARDRYGVPHDEEGDGSERSGHVSRPSIDPGAERLERCGDDGASGHEQQILTLGDGFPP